jgi:uncharacterized protein YyaL (SSP411 family)
MADLKNSQEIDFTVDQQNLYREEAITDLKVASIRRLVPIKADGSDDPSRGSIFMGHTQVMTPEGPLPLQGRLAANNLAEAFEVFPEAMQLALSEMVAQLEDMYRQEKEKKRDDSRIIMPGR